ncbi:hypothetical protein LY76DRAFT_640349 [Colletotrichum caudatum]|nr:hypothetical protein LY76DRAFT_640349 [Colletotrichum caudatum]
MKTGVSGGRDGTVWPPIWGPSDEDKHKEEWEARDKETLCSVPGKPGGGGRHARKPVTLSAVMERKFGDAVEYLVRTSSRHGGGNATIIEDGREHDVAAQRKEAGAGGKVVPEAARQQGEGVATLDQQLDLLSWEQAERDVDALVVQFGCFFSLLLSKTPASRASPQELRSSHATLYMSYKPQPQRPQATGYMPQQPQATTATSYKCHTPQATSPKL